MKGLFSIIKRFLPPYKRYIFLAFLFNIATALLTVVSFSAIIPILNILFDAGHTDYSFIEWGTTELSTMDVLKNNAYWVLTQLIEKYGSSNVLLILAIWLIVTTMFKTGAAYFGSFFTVPIRTGVVRDIRNKINDKILALPISFFSEERKGDILARISGDVNEVEASVMSSLDMFFKNPILIIIYLTTMIVISWQLTIFVLILLPVMGYVMGTVGKKLKRSSLEAQNKWGEMMAQIEETLGGLRIIKAFNAEGDISRRFTKGSNIFMRMSGRIAKRQFLAHPMSEFLGTVTIAIVLWFGGKLILNQTGIIDAATFILYLTIFYSIINPAKEFSRAAYTIQKGLASMERIDKILNAESDIKDPENPRQVQFENNITYKDIWFKYDKDWVIKGINFTIKKGNTIALVGQSGSGKSTLADLLPRFYDIHKGGIYIDGVNIKDFTLHDLRSLIGYVNQDAILFNDTFYNNIAFGTQDATEAEVIEAAKIANAHDFIIATPDGYQTNIGDRGSKLSGGQRQRISIARAVLKNPKILILDEATSSLDTSSERLVQEALEKLMENRTTIIIAHRLSTIINSDIIYVLDEGKIIESGKHTDLYNQNGIYRKLCDMQGNLA